MARSGRFIGFYLTIQILVCSGNLFSQKLFSEVSLDKSSVYVGEPVQVKISVYTSTWFTRGIDLGNIKVNGAFTVYFRPVSTSVVREGQTYAGVELIYNVFPYSEKDLVFPPLDMAVETPPEGDYKGVRREVKSTERRIQVKPVPVGFDPDTWLVTTRLSLSDNWQGDLNNVKVGDVLVRKISRVAQGTVSELIPPIQWDSIPGVSQYQTRSTVQNNNTRTAISATRLETMRFLFEEEGEVTIPALVFSWYDPVQKELFKRTLKEITIAVQPNPDLGVLASVRDSLQAIQAEAMQGSDEEEALTILGYSPQRFALVLVLAGILVVVLVVITRRLLRWTKERQDQYRNSEAYYFQRFITAVGSKDAKRIAQSLYRWIDELQLQEPSIAYFIRKYGTKVLQEEAHLILKDRTDGPASVKLTLNEWKKARKKYQAAKTDQSRGQMTGWINP